MQCSIVPYNYYSASHQTYPRVSVRPSICMYVTLVHSAKTVGRNKMPFGRNARVTPSNIVLDGGPGSPTERGDVGSEPPNRHDQLAAANSKHLY